MSNRRSYPSGLLPALAVLSRNSCYWPGCSEPVFRFVGKKPVVNLQIAHIRAVNPNGPRYAPEMTDEERNSFSNLILLCHPHHTIVDRLEKDKYSTELLEKWKADREAEGRSALATLQGITEARLQQLIELALRTQSQRIDDALKRFEQFDFEAARLLRGLIHDLEDLRASRWLPDPDTVGMLSQTAHQLRPINEDTVSQLQDAARRLERLPQIVDELNDISSHLRGHW